MAYIYKRHEAFKVRDKNARIWRYMDLWKFNAMLRANSLFFCRADKLGDKFEGSTPIKNIEQEMKNLEKGLAEDGSQLIKRKKHNIKHKDFRQDALQRYKDLRREVYIHSWCKSDDESAAMWNLFIKDKQGVAVTTTIKKLIENFPRRLQNGDGEEIYIGGVNYIDFRNEMYPVSPEYNIHRFLYKMKSYNCENELRAVTGPEHSYFASSNSENSVPGKEVPILDVNTFVDNVYVHPEAPEGFEEVVQCLMDKYGLGKKAEKADLRREALF